MSNQIVPLISSGTKGPLGVLHLPRLWCKALLAAVGRLPEGYKDIRPGADYLILEGLNIDPDAAREFINTKRPTYLEFEAWIRDQPGANLTPGNIARLNAELTAKQKGDASRQKILAENGLPDDGEITDSIMLNNLIDWKEFHDGLG